MSVHIGTDAVLLFSLRKLRLCYVNVGASPSLRSGSLTSANPHNIDDSTHPQISIQNSILVTAVRGRGGRVDRKEYTQSDKYSYAGQGTVLFSVQQRCSWNGEAAVRILKHLTHPILTAAPPKTRKTLPTDPKMYDSRKE